VSCAFLATISALLQTPHFWRLHKTEGARFEADYC
jgi:hypothetical protein